MKTKIRFLLLTASVLSVSCGKDIRITGPLRQVDPPISAFCNEDTVLRWSYSQPDAVVSRAVDLLFVADSSLSLMSERQQLARAIPSFLQQLPAEADTRIAVMLAHADSKFTGSLFSHRGDPRVIDTRALSADAAERALSRNLSCPRLEFDAANGEMMMLSLQNSLEDKRFEKIRSQGFFRPDAALSVVFISDENDVCFDPIANGYSTFPDFNQSWFHLEERAYRRHCLNSSGQLRVTAETVLDGLFQRFPGRKISLAGIVHTDPAHVRRFGEDSIGHGIIELVNKTADGVLMDIRTGDFSDALRRLGSVVSTQLQLMTTFSIRSGSALDENSIQVEVDGNRVSATYDSGRQVVTIRAQDAGSARSRISIAACPIVLEPAPQP